MSTVLTGNTARLSICRYQRCILLVNTGRSTTISSDTAQKHGKSPQSRRSYHARRRVFSGIQPTGVPHLGNYLGALRKWKELQDEKVKAKDPSRHTLLFSIVDLHAITVAQDRDTFLRHRRESFASLLAVGLDPKQSQLFMQSSVPQHTQLMWILSTIASTGYLSRMTQWKSKLGLSDDASLDDASARENLKLGLFAYPVLQAADILLYNPTHVPVGEDQAQHIEFARNLAKSFNAHYGSPQSGKPIFNRPQLMLSPAKRIMSLKDPLSKMSKSHADPMSRILITDTPEQIHTKIRGALTDSTAGITYDPSNRPGVSNLVEILKHVSRSEATCEEIASDVTNMTMRGFKEHVSANIIRELEGISDRFREVMEPTNPELDLAMNTGRVKASSTAGHTMAQVEQLIGLRPPHVSTRRKPSEMERGEDRKRAIMAEQEEEERADIEELDVTPQADQGVDRPIAS